MPYIVLPIGEKHYRPLTENISKILKDFSTDKILAEALVFNGKKLPTNLCLCEIDYLDEKNNIYLIQKSVINNQITTTEIEKFRVFYVTFNDADKTKIRVYCQNPKNINNFLVNYPYLCNKQEVIDLLSDYTLFLEYILERTNFIIKNFELFFFFKEAVNTVIAEKQNIAEVSGSLITTDMVQRALDILTNTCNTTNSNNFISQATSSSQNHLSTQPIQQISNLIPNFNELKKTYAYQLNQMHEFGFINDNENIRALLMSDGNLEKALELVISLHE